MSQDDYDRCDEWQRDEDGRRAVPYGPSYMESLMAVEDALVTDEVLDAVVPLDGRWAEPRLLWQTNVFHLRDRTVVDLARPVQGELERLLEHLRDAAVTWHAAASRDEERTTCSAARWAMREVVVPLVADSDPVAWPERTLLVRWLASHTGEGVPPVAAPETPPAPARTPHGAAPAR